MEKHPSFEELVAHLDDLLAPCLAQDWPNLPADRAEGVYVYGSDGRRYLDFLAGFGACNVGHNHPRVVAAAREQMERMVHAPLGVIAPETTLRLAWELGQITPGGADMFFFGNSGAEAVEGALKLARYVTGRRGIVAFLGGFHGRTMGAATVTTSKVKYRTGHGPFLPDVYFARFPYPYRSSAPDPSLTLRTSAEACAQEALEDIERLFEYVVAPEDVAAFLVEPIQGEGGYVIPPRSWLVALREICDRHGILLIDDEVQTGFGRSGEWFAAQVFGVEPDIVCLAKGIANGFPLGATAARREIMGRWGAASHGTTYGGNPISCAAALATLEVIRQENLLENACVQGGYMLEALGELEAESPIVGDVRGVGLMIAVEFVRPGTDKEPNPEAVRRILQRALDGGLLLYPCGHWTQTIRLIPPLTITRQQVDEGLDIFRQAVLAESA
ncbi:MAG: aminotransferase class III-fold pyridoxal phosphate-dependent enzyme [Chloroflexi bacterium]|nr:aminotransferase class III-fold pyridoxal phosphate-dependent enzyme [Chloroflexota bacterium]